jgi:hypothetical protein
MKSLSISALLAVMASTGGTDAAPREVEVIGLDYAFRVPSELPAGRTNFRFTNKGKVKHEFNIVLLKHDVTVQQFIAAANASTPLTPMIDATIGVLFAGPGRSSPSALYTELLAGRTYAIQCIFKDSATAPRHHMLGMYTGIHVTAAKPVDAAPLHVDTIVGMDYAFRYPRTLPPGIHHFAFVNTGKQRHEMSMALLRKGVTLKKLHQVDEAGGDVDPLIESNFGLLHSPGGATPLGQLEINLLPGREYMIECGFSDTDKSKPHYMLGMFGSFRVSGSAARH